MGKRVEIVGAVCDRCGRSGCALYKQPTQDLLCSSCVTELQANEED